MNLGIVQNSLRKFEEAEQSYWNAIRFRKKYPDCYYNLGRLYADLDRHIDALNAWRNATVLKPEHSLAWNNMVILLDNTGNYTHALGVPRDEMESVPMQRGPGALEDEEDEDDEDALCREMLNAKR
ncbi:Transmembrane and TPR repeat-containing protein 4 [Liparis tanakae]|uniref:Transmembrane and TPR repeat-containing protein 4 n=1 Tax=Liparis tanakae TaxID=230148 RepID=A0A4Z2GYD8_9TELE|nr:Transmembrane and TPR repeat-containing protein 4 [Liparis tanakae]